MKRYLAELQKKPDRYKKRFAFLVSGVVTLFIFGSWSLAVFGTSGSKIADSENAGIASAKTNKEISPFQSVRINLATSFEAIRNSFGELKTSLETLDWKTEYKEARDGALNIYGQ